MAKLLRSILGEGAQRPQAPDGPARLPHPEERMDRSRSMENVSIRDVIGAWLQTWNVPQQYHKFWLEECDIKLSLKYRAPAATIAQTREIFVRPEWANPGIIAHEACHIVWQFLTVTQRESFHPRVFDALKHDYLIRLAWQTKRYMQTNNVEAHADIYRYLGDRMPENLKSYYPRLLV